MPFDVTPSSASWDARLELGFRRSGECSVLAHRRHRGPLVVQKPLYPEGCGICHAVILHPPGGIAGGDRLELDVTVGTGAQAMLTTPAAAKWYRANGRASRQHSRFNVDQAGMLEYLPQETIVFDGASVRSEADVVLTQQSRYAGWEIVCLGRQASGERFMTGTYRQRLTIRRNGQPIWHEAAAIAGNDPLLTSPIGLGGASVFAGFVVAAGSIPSDLVEAARAVAPREALRWGITALPEIVSARYLGRHAEVAREWFEGLWRVLRPWYAGRESVRPRLWST